MAHLLKVVHAKDPPLELLGDAQNLHGTLDEGLVFVVTPIQGIFQILLLENGGDEERHHQLTNGSKDHHLVAATRLCWKDKEKWVLPIKLQCHPMGSNILSPQYFMAIDRFPCIKWDKPRIDLSENKVAESIVGSSYSLVNSPFFLSMYTVHHSHTFNPFGLDLHLRHFGGNLQRLRGDFGSSGRRRYAKSDPHRCALARKMGCLGKGNAIRQTLERKLWHMDVSHDFR